MPGGRPTDYRPEYATIARETCMLGATNDILAERFDVCIRTIGSWIATIPEFSNAVAEGRHVADTAVAAALFRRATGMERKVTRVFCHEGTPVTATYTEELPPDVRACIFWLRNRRPEQWNEGRRQAEDKDAWDWSAFEEADRRLADERAAARDSPEADAMLRDAAERLQVHL
jgi:hypothetical protein